MKRKPMIVDAHSHLLAAAGPLDSQPENILDLGKETLDALKRAIDDLDLRAVAILAQEMTRIHGEWLGSNTLMVSLQAAFRKKVWGVAGAEPLDERDLLNRERLDELEDYFRKGELMGLLLTPPYGHYYANDPRCYPFYELARTAGAVVFLHHSAQLGDAHLAPMKYARPWLLDEVAADFPDVKLVVEHMGWPWTQELLAMMAHCPNVWTDISALTCRPHLLAWNLTMARDYGLLDRIVWGTDYVGNSVAEWAEIVRSDTAWLRAELNPLLRRCGWPELTDRELDGILRANALTLFGFRQP